jgi:L-lactate oxidase
MKLFRRDFLSGTAAAAATLSMAGPVLARISPSSPAGPQAASPDPPPAQTYEAPSAVQKINIVNLRELEARAAKIIPTGGFGYIAGGAGDEWTMRENIAAYERVAIEPHYLSGYAGADIATTLLGSKLSMPIVVPPMGGQGLAHQSKEAGTAKGADAADTLFILSQMSNLTMEEVAASSPGPKWFQLYFPEDKGLARELLHRAKAAGYLAIVVTIDGFVGSNRERDTRNHFQSPLPSGNMPKTVASGYAGSHRVMKTDLGWDDVAFVQQETGLPVILKGVLSPSLAAMALERGIAALQVSNHGGRQLDGVPAALTVLPRIAAVVQGRVPIILDGGVRRGQDVFKALALGANVVGVGRPVMYGLALGGWMGVQEVLEHLRAEFVMTMRLAGAASLRDISPQFLAQGASARPV